MGGSGARGCYCGLTSCGLCLEVAIIIRVLCVLVLALLATSCWFCFGDWLVGQRFVWRLSLTLIYANARADSPVLEIIVSRMRYISSQVRVHTLVGCRSGSHDVAVSPWILKCIYHLQCHKTSIRSSSTREFAHLPLSVHSHRTPKTTASHPYSPPIDAAEDPVGRPQHGAGQLPRSGQLARRATPGCLQLQTVSAPSAD